jgi:acetyltransferase-like isoleucine patch superfamily enzyme
MIHKLADIQSNDIGENTSIWQFCVVLKGAKIGKNCNINASVLIGDDVIIGNNVTIKSGVQVQNNVIIEDDVTIGPNTTFTNELFTKNKKISKTFLETKILKGASIGANVTILQGVVIGENAVIETGAVVMHDVPANAIIVGNPAYIFGFVNTDKKNYYDNITTEKHWERSNIEGVEYMLLPEIKDPSGTLSFAEIKQHLPFTPKRYFLVYNVPDKEVRGEHAHKELHQFLICVSGNCTVMIDDGFQKEEYLLQSPNQGLLIPPLVWGVQYKYSPNAVLMVLASEKFYENDYIRNYNDFLNIIKNK